MSIRDINRELVDTLEDICLEVEKIPNKNQELENKLKETFDYILQLRKLEITRVPAKGLLSV
jgi:hypothetical protein